MPSVTVDVQKVDETVDPVPMMERFDYEAKDGLLLRDGKREGSNPRGHPVQGRA